MFERITPEQAGISSRKVVRLINTLNRRGLATHSILLMKGDKLFAEAYWEPFNKDFCHRMYSQTKSFVGIAIGLLEQDGLIDLDRPTHEYFEGRFDKEKLSKEVSEVTVRDMLMMHTAGEPSWWFTADAPDRTKFYFENPKPSRPTAPHWKYDSAGSQVLSSLVEKISGKPLFEFLTERLFSKLGTFKTASMLKTRNGDTWGDSAMLCTLRDLASFGRFCMKKGEWNGEQILNKDYMTKATTPQVSNFLCNHPANSHGYGYQIWITEQEGFSFNGMGCQYTICLPKKDLLFCINSDNQGTVEATDIIFNAFFDFIADEMEDAPLAPDPEGEKLLAEAEKCQLLRFMKGEKETAYTKEISGKKFVCGKNPMGITEFTLTFEGDEGVFAYKNEQGEKEIRFGLGKNVFGNFPQLGYYGDYGGIDTTDGSMYDCAASAGWMEERKLILNVQIIDRYFGNMFAEFSFKDDCVYLFMKRTAENFLNEYEGAAVATQE